MPNASHENHLIFMRMTVQVTYIFIPIVSLKDSFCHSGKSKLGIGLFIHELLREPLIVLKAHYPSGRTWANILLFVWLCVSSVKTDTRRIIRLDELGQT